MIGLNSDTWLQHHQEAFLERVENGQAFSGVISWIPEFDKLTPGLMRGTYSVLGGPSRVGKSSLTMSIVVNNFLYQGFRPRQAVLYVLGEMGAKLFVNRLISQLTGIPGRRINVGDFDSPGLFAYDIVPSPHEGLPPFQAVKTPLTKEEGLLLVATAYRDYLAKWPLFILDDPAVTTLDIEAQAEALARAGYDIPLVVIDPINKLADAEVHDNGAKSHDALLDRIQYITQRFQSHTIVIHDLDKVGTSAKGKPSWTTFKGSSGATFNPDYAMMLWSEDLVALDNGDETQRQPEQLAVKWAIDKDRPNGGIGYVGQYTFYSLAGMFVTDPFWDVGIQRLYDGYQTEWIEPRQKEGEQTDG